MDIRVGGMDGLEATRLVKADLAFAMEEDLARASQAGCSGYLIKPFTKRELVETAMRVAGI